MAAEVGVQEDKDEEYGSQLLQTQYAHYFIYLFIFYNLGTIFIVCAIIFMGHRKFVLIKVNAEIWKHSIISQTKSDGAQVVRQDVNNAEV